MPEAAGRETAPLATPLRVLGGLERRLSALERRLRRAGKERRGEPLEVLVELDWRLGDEVMALPVFAALKRARPADRLSARFRHPALLALNPFVDRLEPLALVPDRVIELGGEEPGRPRWETLARRARVSLDGLRPLVYLSDEERRRPPLAELAARRRPRVALHPRSSQPCKAWPVERWRELGRALVGGGCEVFEVGRDRPAVGVGIDLVGRTDVRGLARILAQVDLVVGEDSGPLHLALAVGTPAVGLFGPTDPALLYPPGAGLAAVTADGGCRGCWPRRRLAWPGGRCPLGRHECMEGIDRRLVEAVVAERLARGRGSAP